MGATLIWSRMPVSGWRFLYVTFFCVHSVPFCRYVHRRALYAGGVACVRMCALKMTDHFSRQTSKGDIGSI